MSLWGEKHSKEKTSAEIPRQQSIKNTKKANVDEVINGDI